ncbi:MAG TPA: hypothetical protein DC009_06340 [Porphyromonadaceae bacterium]|nr:hypothetical protein [Porphyromonadaceae bacterium]
METDNNITDHVQQPPKEDAAVVEASAVVEAPEAALPEDAAVADTDAEDTPDIADDTDTAPLKPVDDEEVKEGIENETPESSWHGRDLKSIREPRYTLSATNWLGDITSVADCELVKVQFKNTRCGYYRNVDKLDLKIGDMVAVEASPGHDIGEVAMVGPLVQLQVRKANLKRESEIKRVFRKARQSDLDKFEEAKSRELDTMIRSRRIAADLGLDMKIGDVEYQGDGGKAIFYYIADERVDFRKLIRLLADAFRVRIEMKQIGARQEAGRIGGIGPCGRPLCCASWMTHFVSVGTSMARMQDLSMNPQKLAGQCAKLKCCLNFEAAAYAESQNKMPHKDVVLQAKDADYYLFKTDILKREITYSTDKSVPSNLVTISARRAHEIIALNKQGIKVDALLEKSDDAANSVPEFVDLADQDSLTRFDKSRRRKRGGKGKGGGQQQQSRKGNGDKNDKSDRQSGKGDNPRRGDQPKNKNGEGGKNDRQRPPRKKQPRGQQRQDSQQKTRENKESKGGNKENREGK